MRFISIPAQKNPLEGGYKANNYYYGCFIDYGSPQAMFADRLYPSPFYVHTTETFTRIGISVTTLSAGNARLGIYSSKNGEPDTLILDAGTVSTGTTGQKEITISQKLKPGFYFLAVVCSATPSLRFNLGLGLMSENQVMDQFNGQSALGGTNNKMLRTFTYAALPATFGAVTYSSTANWQPLIWLRKV